MRQPSKTRELVLTALAAAVISLLAPLSVPLPFTPVPISLASFAVVLCSACLGFWQGTVGTLVYIAVGLVGLPVFAGFTGGADKLFGPTGGYIVGFVFCAAATGWLVDRAPGKVWLYPVAMVAGSLLCYAFGSLWLGMQMHLSFGQALLAGVVPFLPGDAGKIVVAGLVAYPIRQRLEKGGFLSAESAAK